MKKRTLSLLLALLMLAPMTACSETTVEEDESSSPENTETLHDEVETEVDEYQLLLDDVPTGDYEGFAFNMLTISSGFAYTQLDADSVTGEGINDAIYNRNVAVEDKLNITLSEQQGDDVDSTNSTIRNQIRSADKTYSAFWNESHYIAPFASDGSLYNVSNISGFDFDKPWWNDSAMQDVDIGDKRFFLIGDMHLMFKESYQMIGYNKSILDKHTLTDPYQLVNEGTWTMDVMRQYMDTAMKDVDGDGSWGERDIYGVATWNYAVVAFLSGGDVVLSEKNAENIPELSQFDDHFYSVYEKVVETLYSNANYVAGGDFHLAFREGRALFYSEPIGSLKSQREMEDEFGIVPVPKYDEAQENYVSDISRYAAFCGIPITADLGQTAVILENLCAYSFGDLKHAYENDTLSFKYIRNKESLEMLQLIFDTGRFKLTDAFGLNALTDSIKDQASAGNTSIASTLQKRRSAYEKQLNRFVNNMLETDT